jgi:hypothetical protein
MRAPYTKLDIIIGRQEIVEFSVRKSSGFPRFDQERCHGGCSLSVGN